MASAFFALFDDIATVLDDVAVLSKVAARKTAGVLGDDLALNAEQVAGVRAKRELPVVWAVAKGSFVNKAILVPAALAISALAPWAIVPLLMLGGLFLCFEGFEKVAHKFFHPPAEREQHHQALVHALATASEEELLALEKSKIRGAVRTDFILSAEIIVITLGTVAAAAFGTRVTVLTAIALAMTVGVYGLVACIVKTDDLGLYLTSRRPAAAQAIGRGLLRTAPWLMKALSIAGTAAMFLVGGGILAHGVHAVQAAIDSAAAGTAALPAVGPVLGPLVSLALTGALGVAAGAAVVGAMAGARRARGLKPSVKP